MRDAPALTIVPQLRAEGADLIAYDPEAHRQARELLPDLRLAESVDEAVAGADAALILTEWSVFRSLSWRKLVRTMRRPLVIDLRNLYEAQDLVGRGVDYVPLGRRRVESPAEAAAE